MAGGISVPVVFPSVPGASGLAWECFLLGRARGAKEQAIALRVFAWTLRGFHPYAIG